MSRQIQRLKDSKSDEKTGNNKKTGGLIAVDKSTFATGDNQANDAEHK